MKWQPRLLPSWTIQTSFLLPSCPWDHFKPRGHICSIRLFSPQIHWNILRWGERGGETFRIYIDIKHRYRVFIFTFWLSYLFLFWFLIDKTWEKWLFLNFFGLNFNIHNIGTSTWMHGHLLKANYPEPSSPNQSLPMHWQLHAFLAHPGTQDHTLL